MYVHSYEIKSLMTNGTAMRPGDFHARPGYAGLVHRSQGYNRTFLLLTGLISLFHLLNYLNYTDLRAGAYLPEIRAGLTIMVGFIVIVGNLRQLISYHLRINFDLYTFALFCIYTTLYSVNSKDTFIYSSWLFLAVFVVLELARRIDKPKHITIVLLTVVMPTAILATFSNLILGSVVAVTGRLFGALGTHHVDSGVAMDVLLVILAILCLPDGRLRMPTWLKGVLLLVVGWAVYQGIFGLTRSVWISILIGLIFFTYAAPIASWQKLGIGAGIAAVLLVMLVSSVSLWSYVPHQVRERLHTTAKRYESGRIDPRLAAATYGLSAFMDRPQGYGYASGEKAHNTYVNILIEAGFIGGFLFTMIVFRSFFFVFRAGTSYILFFAIGGFPLLVHAFFETQNLPGQANFYPLLIWLALSRSPAVRTVSGKGNVTEL